MSRPTEPIAIWRHVGAEFTITELFGPIILLVLRQLFVHDHQATTGPFVHWSISAVMLLGDTALVTATSLGYACWHGLQVCGDARLLPDKLKGKSAWLPFFWLMLPLAHWVLIEADPFADQLALKPHAWIFQNAHVIFAAYIGARLITVGLQVAWITGLHLQRYRRYGSQARCFTPIPIGGIIIVMVMASLVLYFGAIFLSHPQDINLTIRPLG